MSALNGENIQTVESSRNTAIGSTMVLLIDDQVIVAQSVRRLLADRPNIDLHYCSDPADAIRTANELRPSVILQDWVMPSIDGLDLLLMFRNNFATADTPIIILSSEENPDVKRRAFAAGANDYLVKIPDKVELIARIEAHSKTHLIQLQRDEAFRSLRESQQHLSESNVILISLNQRLEDAYGKLNGILQDTERRAREAVQLTELIDVLQSCHTMQEAYEITKRFLPEILPIQSGALCMTSASRNVVEAVAIWGESLGTEKEFNPISCWALRRGKTHLVRDSESPIRCGHVHGRLPGGYACVPLTAQGETLGVLYLESSSRAPDTARAESAAEIEALSRQTTAVGERISLALANLSLRETLRVQSIRDPLTGLFNRRYMEEALERELRRAARSQQMVSVLMLDIDHFKQFNDTFGHQAGDSILRALGDFINQRTRGQDIACRYGGEEFVLILTGASETAAVRRAELLREDLKDLVVHHANEVLGRITVSIGISVFPDNAAAKAELLRAADQALYLAKHEGRDRIIVSPSQPSAGND
jgi:diguanylate cyclase (GGDEF)-like protein